MNRLYIVLIEKSAYWHVTVWEKKLFVPVLLEEKHYDKTDPEQLVRTLFGDLKQKYIKINNSVCYVCLDPKNVLIKEWEFPFSSPAKIKKAIDIMIDAEMPQANLLTHTVLVNKKDKHEKTTTAYTLSCLTSFLNDWYALLEKYQVARANLAFLPFPYFIGQNHAEEKVYLSLYDESFFSICYKKDSIKKIQYIQLLKNEQNNKYVNAALNLILPRISNTEFVIINDNKQELKKYINEEMIYLPYMPVQIFRTAAKYIKNIFSKKNGLRERPLINSIENIISYNMLMAFDKKSMFFTHKSKTNIAEGTAKNRLIDKLLSPAFIPCYLVVFCAILGLTAMFVDYRNIKQENTGYLNEMQRVYKEALPDAPYFSNFKQLKSVILNRISPESTAPQQNISLAVLEMLSTLFPDNKKIIIKDLTINKNSISMRANTISYEELDRIKNLLENHTEISNVKLLNASVLKEQSEFNVSFEISFNFEG